MGKYAQPRAPDKFTRALDMLVYPASYCESWGRPQREARPAPWSQTPNAAMLGNRKEPFGRTDPGLSHHELRLCSPRAQRV
jgi:hypothetical protein